MESQVEVQEGRTWGWEQARAVFLEGFIPCLVGGEASSAADEVSVVMGDLGLQEGVGLVVTVDSFVSQQGDQAFLEVAEAAFDFSFGGSIRSHAMSDP